MTDPAPQTWTALTRVHDWLDAQGYEIALSTIYDHQKKGKLRKNNDGVYTEKAVMSYAKAHLKRKDGGKEADRAELAAAQKSAAQARLLAAQADKAELSAEQMRGSLIPKEQYEQDLVDRARVLKSDLGSFFRQRIDDLIALVKGNPELAPAALALCEEGLAEFLGRYAEAGVMPAENGKEQP